MSIRRRSLVAFAAAALASRSLRAQGAWPTKTVRIVVPFAPGGTTDILARALAPELAKAFGQSFIVENKAGAGGNLGADIVAKSPPDGYTLLMGTVGTNAINATLYRKLSYDPSKDFTPIALVAAAPVALVVHPSLGVHSMAEFIALAKAKPGTITFGTAGNGTPGHLTGEMFRAATATDLKHVPYRGSAPAVTDLIGGQINAMFDPLQTVLPYVQSGKLLLLGVSSATRSSAAPDAPTFAEAGLKGFEATAWWGVFAPANLPADIATRLNAAIERVVHTDGFRKLLEPRGVQLLGGPRADFARFNASELAKWGKAVRDSGATID